MEAVVPTSQSSTGLHRKTHQLCGAQSLWKVVVAAVDTDTWWRGGSCFIGRTILLATYGQSSGILALWACPSDLTSVGPTSPDSDNSVSGCTLALLGRAAQITSYHNELQVGDRQSVAPSSAPSELLRNTQNRPGTVR
jgi:hypothetical protein